MQKKISDPKSKETVSRLQVDYYPFRIVDIHSNYGTAMTKDLFVAVFFGETQASAVAQMLTAVDRMSRDNNGTVNGITIVRGGAVKPDEAARKALADAWKYLTKEGGAVHSAVVFEGSGAKTFIFRSVVAGFSLIARTLLPIKAFSTVAEAVEYLSPHVKSIAPLKKEHLDGILSELDRQHRIKFPTS